MCRLSLRTRCDNDTDDNLFKTYFCIVELNDLPVEHKRNPSLCIDSIYNEHYSKLPPAEQTNFFHKPQSNISRNSKDNVPVILFLRYKNARTIDLYYLQTTEWVTSGKHLLKYTKTDQLQILHNYLQTNKQIINDMASGKAKDL